MTWTDEVHGNRFRSAIVTATAERKLRKRGLPVPVMPTSQSGPLLAMVAVASGLVAWQRWGPTVRSALERNPVVQQLRELVFGPASSSGPRQVAAKTTGGSGKAGSGASGKVSGSSSGAKVAARKAAVPTPTAAQLAAAAAEARILASAGASTSGSSNSAAPSSSQVRGRERP